MRHLQHALNEISIMRRQLAHSSEFHGYGPATMLCTGGLALVAGAVQVSSLPQPSIHPAAYVSLWAAVAVLCALLTAWQTYTRASRMHSGLSDEMLRMAAEQLAPSLGTGLLLTVVLVKYVQPALWMLPGLWQILFSLGVFASCRFLPRPMCLAGCWYLLCGLFLLALNGSRALMPLAMALPFAVGQALVAGILFARGAHGDKAL